LSKGFKSKNSGIKTSFVGTVINGLTSVANKSHSCFHKANPLPSHSSWYKIYDFWLLILKEQWLSANCFWTKALIACHPWNNL
jgi:hypothetical protein